MSTLLIVMGVSGCGKTTFAQALAEKLNYLYLDADDFHSAENKAHMASGKPLTDAMRLPWVNTMKEFLQKKADEGVSCTLAFSGLKKEHRNILRQTDMQTRYIFLDGSKELITRRMTARKDHFMPSSLIDSQFSSMERPTDEDDVIFVDIAPPIQDVLTTILQGLK